MTTLLEIGLINAALATILAIVVWLATRVWRQPVLVHALWVIVLIKLVTPPMINIPWHLSGAPTMPPLLAEYEAGIEDKQTNASPIAVRAAESQETYSQDATNTAPLLASGETILDEFAVPALMEASPSASSWPMSSWFTIAAAVWLAGSGVFLVVTIIRLTSFHGALGDAAPAPPELSKLAERVAERLGVSGYRLRVTDGRLSPLVWPIGRPTIVLSRPLVAELSPEETESLLAHELAHLRRKDHWVRWLELVAVTIYWWHPVAWWARRMIRNSEERACDAWVVWAFPDAAGRYASALFTAAEFVTNSRPVAPLVASRLSAGPNLKERIENVMSGKCQCRLSLLHKLAVLILILLILPISIRAVRAADERDKSVPEEKLALEPVNNPPADSVTASRPHSGIELEIERQLQTPVKLQFIESPLEEVMAQLGNSVGIDIHIDREALGAEGITVDEPVTITLKNNVSLRSALNLILKPFHLSFVVEDEVLKITQQPPAPVATSDIAAKVGTARSTRDNFDVHGRVVPPSPAAGAEEIQLLREHAAFLEERFKTIDATNQTGSRGGSQEVRDMTGYEMATAQAQLALAEGHRDEALSRLKDAERFAESGLRSAKASYEAGGITNDLVLQAANNLAESKRHQLQLRTTPATTASVSPPFEGRKTSPREAAQTTPASESSLSIGVIKKIVEGRKQYYERLQSLADKNLASASELQNAKNEYETNVALYQQALRALQYHQLLVELAETEYQQAVEVNKVAPSAVPELEVKKYRIKMELAKAKLSELSE